MKNGIISTILQKYLEKNLNSERALLQFISQYSTDKYGSDEMISGHYQGCLLSMLSKIVNPKYILELGTCTGYSTLCLLEGLQPNGEIHTVEKDSRKKEFLETIFSRTKNPEQIHLYIEDALTVISRLDYSWDFVFIDADKKKSIHYYEYLFERIKIGGLILIDNVLWKQKVVKKEKDATTQAICQLNEIIQKENRAEKLILPVRDGLYVIRRMK